MVATDIIRGKVFEDGGATCMARIIGQAGVAITQASLTSIGCKVFDLGGATPDTPIATSSLTISSVVFDTLQTDARWTYDTTGYNFLHAHAAATFPSGDTRYRVEYLFTPVSGAAFFAVFELQSLQVKTS